MSSFHLLKEATKMVQPSLRREGFSSVPDVTWDDVGGLDSLRKEFDRCIIQCIKHPEDYEVNTELYCLSFIKCSTDCCDWHLKVRVLC